MNKEKNFKNIKKSILTSGIPLEYSICQILKKFEIKLTDEQEDKIHKTVWEVLEGVSNGYYKNHN